MQLQEDSDLEHKIVEALIAESEPMLHMPYDVLKEVRFQPAVKRAITMREFDLAHLDFKKLLAHLKTDVVQLQNDALTTYKTGKRSSKTKRSAKA